MAINLNSKRTKRKYDAVCFMSYGKVVKLDCIRS